MSLAVQSSHCEMLAPPPIPSAMAGVLADLATHLQVPGMVLRKLMLDAIRYPVVHRDLTHHSQLVVSLVDGQTGQLMPLPPIMLSFLEEGVNITGEGYTIPLTIDLEQYPEFPARLSRAQWVLHSGTRRIEVPLFSLVEVIQEDGSLWIEDAFPLGELVRSARETAQQLPYFNFVHHLDYTGNRSGVAIAILDDADAPVSHFGSYYSLHRAMIAQRHYIHESLRLGFAAVLVPQLCHKGLPMRYQAVHRQDASPKGLEHRTLKALQEQVVAQKTTDIWVCDQTATANLYGGYQALVDHWRELDLLVQREGCLPVQLPFIEVLEEDQVLSRTLIRVVTPLLSRDEFQHEDELL